jgi:hypothetical protein
MEAESADAGWLSVTVVVLLQLRESLTVMV